MNLVISGDRFSAYLVWWPSYSYTAHIYQIRKIIILKLGSPSKIHRSAGTASDSNEQGEKTHVNFYLWSVPNSLKRLYPRIRPLVEYIFRGSGGVAMTTVTLR
jgi:hypothetical protein